MRAEGIFAFLCVLVCSSTDALLGKTCLFVAVSAAGRQNDRDFPQIRVCSCQCTVVVPGPALKACDARQSASALVSPVPVRERRQEVRDG